MDINARLSQTDDSENSETDQKAFFLITQCNNTCDAAQYGDGLLTLEKKRIVVGGAIAAYEALVEEMWYFAAYLQNQATDVDTESVHLRELLEQTLGMCTETTKVVDECLMKYKDCVTSLEKPENNESRVGIEWVVASVLNRVMNQIRRTANIIRITLNSKLGRIKRGESHAGHSMY